MPEITRVAPSLRRLSIPVIVLAATVLSGCAGVRPGVAIETGDERVASSRVDDVLTRYCDAIGQVSPQPVARREVRNQVVGALAATSAADAFAAPYDVEAGAAYTQAVARLRTQLRDFDADTQDAIVAVEGASAYIDALATAVGHELEPGADDAAAGEAGRAALTEWLDENDVTINPRYGLRLDGDQLQPQDTSVSVAARDSEEPQGDAASLPSAQRCG